MYTYQFERDDSAAFSKELDYQRYIINKIVGRHAAQFFDILG